MKYRIKKPGLNIQNAEIGDIVEMNDSAAKLALEKDIVENCDQSLPNKHCVFLATPMDIKLKVLSVN